MYQSTVAGRTYVGNTILEVETKVRAAIKVATQFEIVRVADKGTAAWCYAAPLEA